MPTTHCAHAIDLTDVSRIVDKAYDTIDRLDGQVYDDRTAVTSQSKGRARQDNARLGQSLNRLADHLELAAKLVRNEYWAARGDGDSMRD